MSEAQLRIEIQAIADQATSEIARLQEQIQSLEGVTRQSNLGEQFQRTGQQITSVGQQITSTMIGIGGGIVQTAGNFEQSMNNVQAKTGETGNAIEQLREQAKQLGSGPGFSATEAADAMTFLGMAGFNSQQIMAAMPSTLALAASENMSLAKAADIASDVMGGFQMEASQMEHVANVLAETSRSANTGVVGLGDAFSYAAPVANNFGMGIEESAAILGSLANVGIKASRGGTTLAGALDNLMSPTDKMSGRLEELGISIRDNEGNFKSFTNILQQIADSSAEGGDISTIFGKEAGRGISALVSGLREGTVNLEEFTKANQEAMGKGVLDEIVNIQQSGFNAAMDSMGSAFEAVQIAIAETGLLNDVARIVRLVADLTRMVANANPQLLKIGVVIGTLVLGIGALLIPLGMVINAIGVLMSFQAAGGIAALGTAFTTAAAGAWAFVSPLLIIAAKIVLVGALIATVAVGFTLLGGKILQFVATAMRGIADFIAKVEEVLGIPAIFSTAMNEAAAVVDNFGKRMYDAGLMIVSQLAEGIKAAVGKVTEAWSWVTSKLTPAMPQSDAKVGPLSNLTSWGQAIPETIAKGMMMSGNALPMALEGLTPTVLSPPSEAIATGTTNNSESPVTVNITLNSNGESDQSLIDQLRSEGEEIARIVQDAMAQRDRTRYA